MDVIRWRSAFSGGVERSRGVVLNQSEAAAVRRGWKSWSGVEWSECVVGAFVRSFVRSFGRSFVRLLLLCWFERTKEGKNEGKNERTNDRSKFVFVRSFVR